MATIYLSLSTKKSNISQEQEVLLRFVHGQINQRAKTNVFVSKEYFDKQNLKITIPTFRSISPDRKILQRRLIEQNEKLSRLIQHIHKSFTEVDRSNIAENWLKNLVNKYNFPEKQQISEAKTFFSIFEDFTQKHQMSKIRKRDFGVIIRAWQRYEYYTQIKTNNPKFVLTLENITADTLYDWSNFLKQEAKIYSEYPNIYERFPEKKKLRITQGRGQNTISAMLGRFRAFYRWAQKTEKTKNNPFEKFRIEPPAYGTPYYITIEERNHLYRMDLSNNPKLAVQRDIFVFHCVIGCRVSDLYQFTKDNIIGGAIEYIQRKGKDKHPITIKVPLNTVAQEILDKYKNFGGRTLFPFISQQKYNEAIKEIFTIAGLTRYVIVQNTLTRDSVAKPLNEIASSHLARRTFIGNLYKKVKDPNLIGSLSGHVEGSQAFNRYRAIDDNIKIELTKMLE